MSKELDTVEILVKIHTILKLQQESLKDIREMVMKLRDDKEKA